MNKKEFNLNQNYFITNKASGNVGTTESNSFLEVNEILEFKMKKKINKKRLSNNIDLSL